MTGNPTTDYQPRAHHMERHLCRTDVAK